MTQRTGSPRARRQQTRPGWMFFSPDSLRVLDDDERLTATWQGQFQICMCFPCWLYTSWGQRALPLRSALAGGGDRKRTETGHFRSTYCVCLTYHGKFARTHAPVARQLQEA